MDKTGSRTCTAGLGGKFMAYGANGHYVFADVPAGPVYCWPSTFRGIDPLQGVVKTCFMSSLTLLGYFGTTITPAKSGTGAKGPMTIAFGGNGMFNFPYPVSTSSSQYPQGIDASETFVCSDKLFGPIPSGATLNVGCYQSLTGYHFVASEHGSMTVGNNAPIAMGENGTFAYTRKSGTITCDWPSLFVRIARPVLSSHATSWTPLRAPRPSPRTAISHHLWGSLYVRYFGNVIVKQLAFDGNVHGFYCNNSTFGGDPVPGQTEVLLRGKRHYLLRACAVKGALSVGGA